MSEERIGDKFLRKLYEKADNDGTGRINREEIGKEIGIVESFLFISCSQKFHLLFS